MVRTLTEVGSYMGLRDFYVPGGKDKTWEEEPFEKNKLTSDKSRYERGQAILKAAPELGLGYPTWGWMRAASRSMAKINDPQFPGQVEVPVLIVGAGNDEIVSTRATEDMSVRLKVGSHLFIPKARHEILQEMDELRLQFWAAFDAYVPG